MKKAAVVIPVFKDSKDLTDNEYLSLNRAAKVFHDVQIVFVCSFNLAIDPYHKIFQSRSRAERFESFFFESVKSYNRLCLSTTFYRRFLEYDFILIYQTDAYVFKNELLKWVEFNYDYIGAPFNRSVYESFDIQTWTVGNGGFSLRAVKKCYQLTRIIERNNCLLQAFTILKLKSVLLNVCLKAKWWKILIVDKIVRNKYNEDYVFGVVSRQLWSEFYVAPIIIALQFSFESHPQELYKLNNFKLPFGCHAWERYDKDFWKNFI